MTNGSMDIQTAQTATTNESFKTRCLFALVLFAILCLANYLLTFKGNVEKALWHAGKANIQQADGSWHEGHVRDIDQQSFIQELRFTIEIDESEHWQRPMGLVVAGPFTAELSWNGLPLGNKGRIPTDNTLEEPGNIDALVFVPAELLTPGQHELQMTVSTQQFNYATRIIHILALVPYRNDARRSLRYYALPVLLASGLLVFAINSLISGYRRKETITAWLGIFSGFILLSLLTEVSRALINYPYQYHQFRGFAMWFFNLISALTLCVLCYRQITVKWQKWLLLLPVALFFIPISDSSGDRQLATNFILLSLGPALIYSLNWRRPEIGYMAMFPIFWVICLGAAVYSYGLFLDASLFISSVLFLIGFWVWRYLHHQPILATSDSLSSEKQFVVKTPGKETVIENQKVIFIQAIGNYTKLITADGESPLHQDGLGKIMEGNPKGFLRVHKSFAVNVRFIQSLRNAPGSKYWLEMAHGNEVPVSRLLVSDVREVLQIAGVAKVSK